MKDGGSAFPWKVRTEPNSYDAIRGVTNGPKEAHEHIFTGMSLWNYLAAHAPDDFTVGSSKITKLEIPPMPDGAAYCEGCKADTDCEGTESCLKMQQWRIEKDHIRAHNLQWVEVQKRCIYADAMIAEFERRGKI